MFFLSLFRPGDKEVQACLQRSSSRGFCYEEEVGGSTQLGHPLPNATALRRRGYVIDHRAIKLGEGSEVYLRAKRGLQQWAQFQLPWAFVNPSTPITVGSKVCVCAHTIAAWVLNPLEIVYVQDYDGLSAAEKTTATAATTPPVVFSAAEKTSTATAIAAATAKPASMKHVAMQRTGDPLTLRTRVRSTEKIEHSLASSEPSADGRQIRQQEEKDQQLHRASIKKKRASFAFGHGTLKGHFLAGEERFAVDWRDDNSVWYEVMAFSRSANLVTSAMYPLARFLQRQFGKQSAEAMENYMGITSSEHKNEEKASKN